MPPLPFKNETKPLKESSSCELTVIKKIKGFKESKSNTHSLDP